MVGFLNKMVLFYTIFFFVIYSVALYVNDNDKGLSYSDKIEIRFVF